MVQRPAHGGTSHPSHQRPGSGFARGAGRPGPRLTVAAAPWPEPEWFEDDALVPTGEPLADGLVVRQTLDR